MAAEAVAILVAPTEPPELRAIGITSSWPERFGVDVWWSVGGEAFGLQRKTVDDLIASVTDGRMLLATGMSTDLSMRVLIVEGRPVFTIDGNMVRSYGRSWTRATWWQVLVSAQAAGWKLVHTADLGETIELVGALVSWSQRSVHRSMLQRPTDGWGMGRRTWQLNVLMGLPAMGPARAAAILDAVGMPLSWRVERRQLLKVRGVGKRVVERWEEVIPRDVADGENG